MTRARGSDGVEEEEEEKYSTIVRGNFKVLDWDGPELVNRTVTDWICDYPGHIGKSTVANFFRTSYPQFQVTPKRITSSGFGCSTWSPTTWLKTRTGLPLRMTPSTGESSSCPRRTGKSHLLYGQSQERRTARNIVHGWKLAEAARGGGGEC